MKYILIILTILMISACSSNSGIRVPKSDEVTIISIDEDLAIIDDRIISIEEGLTVTQLLAILVAADSSEITLTVLNSEGLTKQSNLLYEFEQVQVISESGRTSRTYNIRYKG